MALIFCLIGTIDQSSSTNEAIETINHLVSVSNETISNQIAAVNTLLMVFSIILALIGAGLGIYITKLHNKALRIKSSFEEKEQTILELAKTIEETDRKIQNDLKGLFKQLQHEETIALLKRLEDEPLDINHLCPQLLTRSLDEDCFHIVKNAYFKFLETKPQPNDFYEKRCNYRILLFQHFSYLSLLDEDLRDDFVDGFSISTLAAFKQDIIKSTKDICKALAIDSAPFNKVDILTSYLKAINLTKFRDLLEIKNTLEEKVKDSILIDAIENCRNDKCYLSMFGVYKPDNSNGEDNSDYKEDE